MKAEKERVRAFWNERSCGEDLYLASSDQAGYERQAAERYRLEPYIPDFAGFSTAQGLRVLEIGIGLGADHQRFAAAGARLSGIDLTERAVRHTQRRFAQLGLHSDLLVGDGESLPFRDGSFDRVYSWGVLHHSPDTPAAINEVHRILKPGGTARLMVYQKYSLVGVMLWLRYALLRLRPWTSLGTIYAQRLESPGTKAYTVGEARSMLGRFETVSCEVILTHGDLLSSAAGQRHRGPILSLTKKLWPRWLLRRLCGRFGLFLLIRATK